MAWLPRSSGLVEKRELPQLTMAGAIERGWHRRGGGLMLPDEREYLITYPYSSADAEILAGIRKAMARLDEPGCSSFHEGAVAIATIRGLLVREQPERPSLPFLPAAATFLTGLPTI